MAKINALIQDKQRLIQANEVRYAERFADGCDLPVVAFGSAARNAQPAIGTAREAGRNVGQFRPNSPFPLGYCDSSSGLAVSTSSSIAGKLIENLLPRPSSL